MYKKPHLQNQVFIENFSKMNINYVISDISMPNNVNKYIIKNF
jgi:hypothetical protein